MPRNLVPQGNVGAADAVEPPDNPTAQNAATAALKPKVGTATPTPGLPEIEALKTARTAATLPTTDPNAYSPPPQQDQVGTERALAATSGMAAQPAPPSQAQTGIEKEWGSAEDVPAGTPYYQAFNQNQSTPLSPEEQKIATRIMQGDQSLMNEYKQKYGADWLNKWGADQDMYDARLRNQTATAQDINGLRGMSGQKAWDVISGKTTIGGSQDGSQMGTNYMNALRAMTPDQRQQFLGQWKEGSYDRQLIEGGLAAQGITAQNADTGRRWNGATQNMGAMAPAVPVYQEGTVRGTGVNSQGLEGFDWSNAAAKTAASTQGLPGVSASQGGQGGPTGQTGAGNVAQTATTPENALTLQTLSRAPGADRYQQAMSQWDAWQKSTNPQYQAANRDALRQAAAGGSLGSGMLNTSLGDLAANRQLQMDTQKQNFLSQALTGSIEDAFRDVGIAQQQQGFQKGQQDTAFQNAMQGAGLQEALRSGAFNRALQSLTAGSNNNPADVALMLSQIFGGQAGQASGSLGGLFGALGQRSTSGGNAASNPNYLSLLTQLFGGGAKPAGTTYSGQGGYIPPGAV